MKKLLMSSLVVAMAATVVISANAGAGYKADGVKRGGHVYATPPGTNAVPDQGLLSFRQQANEAARHADAAERWLESGKLDKAEDEALLAIQTGPRLSDGEAFGPFLQALGDVYMAERRYEKALDAYTRALKSTGGDELGVNIAICECRIGKPNLAKGRTLAALIRRYDGKKCGAFVEEPTNAQMVEGYAFWAKGVQQACVAQPERAAKCYVEAQRLLPRHPLLARDHALAAMDAGQYEAAVKQFATVDQYGAPELRRRCVARAYRATQMAKAQKAGSSSNSAR